MKKIWRSRYLSTPAQIDGVPPAVGRFLAARGYSTQEDLEALIDTKLEGIADAFSIPGVSFACDRLRQAFDRQEKICIYADFDMDGTSGLALLLEGLKSLGFSQVIYYQPRRLLEGYGFHATAVEDLKSQSVSLIITVDVGTTAFEACQRAKELGIDVIVTDHHQAAEQLPEALVIINPNLPGSNSDLGYLSGAGVAFYLLRALKRTWHDHGMAEHDRLQLKSLLDFFVIGTLTDMVPLIKDNRVLVRYGLKVFENTTRQGLRALLDDLSLSRRKLSSNDIAIRLAPKLNAASRLEQEVRPIDILLETDAAKAQSLSARMIEQNSLRIDLQVEAVKEALHQLRDWPHKNFVYVSSPSFHRGVIGLVATQLTQQFRCPAFVGTVIDGGAIVGSARAFEGLPVSVHHLLEKSQNALIKFGGHHQAAGFELTQANERIFLENLYLAAHELSSSEIVHEVPYDIDLSIHEIDSNLMEWIDALGPYGAGFSAPLFALKGLDVEKIISLRGGHKKYKFFNMQKVDALHFNSTTDISSAHPLDVLAELQWNYFAGKRSLQLLIKELRPHAKIL